FIATNPDVTGPAPQGILPATGSVAALITAATNREPYYVGKPNPVMMRSALNNIGVHSENTVMIGDRMDTDVKAGLEAGMRTILVRTGTMTDELIARFPFRPSRVLASVAGLPDRIMAPSASTAGAVRTSSAASTRALKPNSPAKAVPTASSARSSCAAPVITRRQPTHFPARGSGSSTPGNAASVARSSLNPLSRYQRVHHCAVKGSSPGTTYSDGVEIHCTIARSIAGRRRVGMPLTRSTAVCTSTRWASAPCAPAS